LANDGKRKRETKPVPDVSAEAEGQLWPEEATISNGRLSLLTLFDQFLKERTYLENVTPKTLTWYRIDTLRLDCCGPAAAVRGGCGRFDI